jgi:hypothetical protein
LWHERTFYLTYFPDHKETDNQWLQEKYQQVVLAPQFPAEKEKEIANHEKELDMVNKILKMSPASQRTQEKKQKLEAKIEVIRQESSPLIDEELLEKQKGVEVKEILLSTLYAEERLASTPFQLYLDNPQTPLQKYVLEICGGKENLKKAINLSTRITKAMSSQEGNLYANGLTFF